MVDEADYLAVVRSGTGWLLGLVALKVGMS